MRVPTRVSCARLATDAMEPRHMLCARLVLILWEVLQRAQIVRKAVIAMLAATATVLALQVISAPMLPSLRIARLVVSVRKEALFHHRAPPAIFAIPREANLRAIVRHVKLAIIVRRAALTQNHALLVLIAT